MGRRFARVTKCLIASVILAGLISTSSARVNVVSLPGRDSVQLTIYNSVDLTLVKETRVLTFRKGLNRLEFSWANTLIDPTSVEFRGLTHAADIEVLDVSFPPRVSNTLEWRIQSEFAGEVEVEIRYFTSGISWAADYVIEANTSEKMMGLAGNVRINNHSGEDYENAQVRLVVGVIRLVEEIARLAGTPLPAAAPAEKLAERSRARGALKLALSESLDSIADKPREVIKENLSEYFLYTVEGSDTIADGWSKRMPSFHVGEVPINSYYKYERERWGDQVIRYYKFKNDAASHLGREPLPDGDVKAFRLVTADKLYSFVGRTVAKYIPIDETVELELGPDPEVLVKPALMNWEKTDLRFDTRGNVTGWTTRETWQVELQNSRDIDVTVDIRRNFPGDWSLTTGAKYEKVDAHKIKFVIPLKPREKQKLSYEVTTRHGTNVVK